jgi:hypothetical protein
VPTNVTVKLAIGIPSAGVLYRDPIFGAGGAFNGGTKCAPAPVVDLDKQGAAALTIPPLGWEITHRYQDADALLVRGKPDWYRSLRPGATPTETATLARSPDNLEVQWAQLAGATHALKFTVNGTNPLLPEIAPDIDAAIIVGLRKQGGGIQYSVDGKHDGFPNYTLEINGKRVYLWDCVASGQDPSNLADLLGQAVKIGWTTL